VRLVELQDRARGGAEQALEVRVVLVGEPGDFAVWAARGGGVEEGWAYLGAAAGVEDVADC